jgi:hypothetical protein
MYRGCPELVQGEPFMVRQAHHERRILVEFLLMHYAEEIGVNGLVGGDDGTLPYFQRLSF